MNKTKLILFSALMAIVMMAICPTKMWAEEETVYTVEVTTTSGIGYYDDVQLALASAANEESATMKLLEDITLPDGTSLSFDKGDVTLDLNGHTISANYFEALKATGGNLTIIDSSEGQNGMVSCKPGYAVNATKGSLTIYSGKFTGSMGLYGNSAATVALYGGRFVGTGNAIFFIGASALADGYAYFNTKTDMLLDDVIDRPIQDETDNNSAQDITVKTKPEPTVTKVTLDEEGNEKSKEEFTTLAEALKEINGKTVITLSADHKLKKDFSDSDYNDITFDLNGHTIDGTYTAYETVWDEMYETWVDDPESAYQAYKSVNVTSNLTIMNGTMKASVSASGDINVLTLDNAILEGDYISWQAATGIDIKNGSTLNLTNAYGEGNFTFEACKLDQTSQVVLTGINTFGMYGNVPGGYREILHRLQLPEGYILQQPYSDFNFGIYNTENLENKANMKDITITIKGSDPLTDCMYAYTEVGNHDESWEKFWPEYHPTCTLCRSVDEEGRVVSEDEGNTYTCKHANLTHIVNFNIPVSFYAEKASYNRNMTDCAWDTFCLPFELSISENDTFGYYTMAEINSDNEVVMSKVEEGPIPAGTPLVVKRNEEETSVSISAIGVTLSPSTVIGSTVDYLTLKGTLAPADVTTGYYLDTNDGLLHNTSTGASAIPAFHAWFDSELPEPETLKLVFPDSDITAISTPSAFGKDNTEIYNISGNRTGNMQKGVNIVRLGDGKTMKVVVK